MEFRTEKLTRLKILFFISNFDTDLIQRVTNNKFWLSKLKDLYHKLQYLGWLGFSACDLKGKINATFKKTQQLLPYKYT